MSSIVYAPVTAVDGVSVGAADAVVFGLDYRYAGELTNILTYAWANASVGGAGESITIQVSPDWKHDAPSNAGAMWATYAILSTAGGTGVVQGPWSAVRAIKGGGGGAGKLVFLAAGKSRNLPNVQG